MKTKMTTFTKKEILEIPLIIGAGIFGTLSRVLEGAFWQGSDYVFGGITSKLIATIIYNAMLLNRLTTHFESVL